MKHYKCAVCGYSTPDSLDLARHYRLRHVKRLTAWEWFT